VTAKRSTLDFSGQSVYVGVDVGRKSWSVSIYTDQFEHKTFSQPPEAAVLVGYLHKHFPGASYKCVYEAGYCGFWPERALSALGVDCIVVHPCDVPTTDKERRNRTDRVDARKLARALRADELKAVYVPSRAAQEDRNLVRSRQQLVKKQTRCKNQIKALLACYGITPSSEADNPTWSRRYLEALQALEFERPSGQRTLELLLQELAFLRGQIADVTRQIRALASEEPYRENVELLRTIPGISLLSAMILLTELVDVRRFGDQDHLAGYVGLKPGEDSSGDKQTVTGLTHRRNAHLRALLIECSWVAVRKDPALLLAFSELTKRMKKAQAIIRIARKLLNRIHYVLKHRQPYVTCVVQ
jgi:transposase